MERQRVKTRIELIARVCMETEEEMSMGFIKRRGAVEVLLVMSVLC